MRCGKFAVAFHLARFLPRVQLQMLPGNTLIRFELREANVMGMC
jgi:hypothetical protein